VSNETVITLDGSGGIVLAPSLAKWPEHADSDADSGRRIRTPLA
jgi:hypothetical protein